MYFYNNYKTNCENIHRGTSKLNIKLKCGHSEAMLMKDAIAEALQEMTSQHSREGGYHHVSMGHKKKKNTDMEESAGPEPYQRNHPALREPKKRQSGTAG